MLSTVRYHLQTRFSGYLAYDKWHLGLYRIGGINDFPDRCGKFENWGDCVPVLFPAPHGRGVFFTPFFRDPFQDFQGFFFRGCLIPASFPFR